MVSDYLSKGVKRGNAELVFNGDRVADGGTSRG